VKKDREWMRGKAGKGYKVLGSGSKDRYLAVTIPLDRGFVRGDRVYLKPMIKRGIYGLFITKNLPSTVDTSVEK
jgi:hypothetical protein